MEKYALIIGIEDYPASSGQRKVKFAKNDAMKMADYARNAGFQLIGEGPILDEKATCPQVIEYLDLMFHYVQPEDFVFLYYAGHGYYSEYGGYLITYDYNKKHEINEGTCISFDIFNKRLKAKKPTKFVFFLDTCHSGFAGKQIDIREGQSIKYNNTSAKVQQKVKKQMKNLIKGIKHDHLTGRVIFASSSPLEKSRGIDEFKHGLFTYFLLKGLKSDENHQEISIEELIQFTKKEVLSYSITHHLKQIPVVCTNIQGEFYIPTYNPGIKDKTSSGVPDSIIKSKIPKDEQLPGKKFPHSNNEKKEFNDEKTPAYTKQAVKSLVKRIKVIPAILITLALLIAIAFILNNILSPPSPVPFDQLGDKVTVSQGILLSVREKFEYSSGKRYWICFIDDERIWPMVEISEPEFTKSVAVPTTGFYGGKIILARAQKEDSERFNNWLRKGRHNPLMKPKDIKIILETKINIR